MIAFVDQLAGAHVNTLVMELKTSAGLFWPSERFAPAVVTDYREFDLPAVLIRECHRRGIAFHVWFFDFAEGASSYVARQHPEWLARSPQGEPTSADVLRGQPYRMAWMCPARRPGYTDQWLIPLIEEFVGRYDVDAVHHDYVRYPGDLDSSFYEYRVHHVTEFTRRVFEAVRKVKPRMEFSAAVFKNPVQSGRFIGQDWRRFSPWVQYLMPMDRRSHYAGDFETHLDLLAESIQQQKARARDFAHLWPGIAAYQLYDEEREPPTRLRRLLREGGQDVAGMRTAFERVAPRLGTFSPGLHDAVEAYLAEPKGPGELGASSRPAGARWRACGGRSGSSSAVRAGGAQAVVARAVRARRQVAGAVPTSFLKARLNAASDS